MKSAGQCQCGQSEIAERPRAAAEAGEKIRVMKIEGVRWKSCIQMFFRLLKGWFINVKSIESVPCPDSFRKCAQQDAIADSGIQNAKFPPGRNMLSDL